MRKPLFVGACTAVITPFREDRIDLPALENILEEQYRAGIAAVTAAGTTGEAPTLSHAEWRELISFCVSRLPSSVPVIAGIGGNHTEKCLALAREAGELGAQAVLLTAPYYNKTNRDGLLRHFLTVAENSPLPLILYDVPSRTGMTLSPELLAELSFHPNICGVKDATGSLSHASRTLALCSPDFSVWSGNDSDTLPMMALGGSGVISVASNLVPGTVASLCRAFWEGDLDKAKELHFRLEPLFHALFLETNPIPVKTAMALLGKCTGELRLPLGPMSKEGEETLSRTLNALLPTE